MTLTLPYISWLFIQYWLRISEGGTFYELLYFSQVDIMFLVNDNEACFCEVIREHLAIWHVHEIIWKKNWFKYIKVYTN